MNKSNLPSHPSTVIPKQTCYAKTQQQDRSTDYSTTLYYSSYCRRYFCSPEKKEKKEFSAALNTNLHHRLEKLYSNNNRFIPNVEEKGSKKDEVLCFFHELFVVVVYFEPPNASCSFRFEPAFFLSVQLGSHGSFYLCCFLWEYM